MKDKLEEYIKENKEKMDHLEPPVGLWNKIQKGNDASKKDFNYNLLWKAAAVIFFAIALGLWFDRPSENQQMVKSSYVND
jgi:hypothetical protein